MTKKILIDATHSEETRVAITENNILEDFEVESITKKEIKGNIYLAKVIRVEPSLQSAFVEYGGVKHGFLPFSEIHPDYFQIPIEDKKALLITSSDEEEDEDNNQDTGVETFSDDEDEIAEKQAEEKRKLLLKKYKIQEVIKSGQILLIQVEKEERGNKGAAITTYISLAGRYCVLMPNSNKRVKYGVSRKIPYGEERKELKNILKDLPISEGMTVIARTAGCNRTYKDILGDYNYLINLWNNIRKTTLASTAPALIHEEGDLLHRTIRDMYKPDVDEILIEGDEGYRQAIEFAKQIGFDEIKKIKKYNDKAPLFIENKIEAQLEAVQNPIVKLPSGGYLVINPTEALTAIDVNSGRATKERNIEETALKTNIESAIEIGRQLRLRDMGGLVVVDFIDMLDPKHNQAVEQKMREALKKDRAKVQMAKLSQFGLMEISRQRLRPSFLEVGHKVCPHCLGTGFVPSVQTASINLLRHIEEELLKKTAKRIYVAVSSDVALYTLNQKRDDLLELEERYDTSIIINGDDNILNEKSFVLEKMDLDRKLGTYFREKEPANTKFRNDSKKQKNTELIKKSPANKMQKTKKQKKGFFAKLFG
ncbi:MAG: ribonuclease E/G [Alphaproteobacteria bacterium]|nr:ribonuclease E/G [Alphaproteobacteria bacterium]MBR4316907.1 ribonuclease E/G [Alphaproteobacteria bacterium]